MTKDFLMGQLRLILVALLAYGNGKGWFSAVDAGLITQIATPIGIIAAPWIWSIYTNLNSKLVPNDSVAISKSDMVNPNTASVGGVAVLATDSPGGRTATAKIVGALLLAVLLSAPFERAYAQTASRADPAVSLAVKLRILTSDKLQAALDDAVAHDDPYSPDCYRALQPIVAAAEAVRATSKPAAGADINLVLLYQKGRDLRRAAQSLQAALNGGGNVEIVRACAPMALDSETVINQVVNLIGGAALIIK